MPPEKGVLFLCVANSARSQMAEGFARRRAPEGIEVYSAGSRPGRLSRHAVRVMLEVGIDISSYLSKGIEEIPLDRIDTVVTLCADEVCPVLSTEVRRLHWPFEDPFAGGHAEEQQLAAFRRVRDGIRKKVEELFR